MAGRHHIPEEMQVESYMEMKHPRYLCPYGCNKLIATRTIDYHKNNGCGRRLNDSITIHPELKKRFYCCGACFAEFITRSEFHAHLRVEHDVHPEVHTMAFPDRPSFDRFIRWLEVEGGAHLRHKSGAKRRGRGKGIFLACNRSGYVSNEKTVQRADRTGPFRLGYTCTAYVHATEHGDGHVTAELCGDHYGHDARMRLPNVIKYIIAQKQIEGATSLEIMAYLRNHFLNLVGDNIYAQRICYVDSDELKSIYLSNTRKWVKDGIPKVMEIWEEELLDKVGIVWPIPRDGETLFEPRRKGMTTSDIAIQERWPRPRVFVTKTRREDGVLVPFDITNLGGADDSVATDDYVQEDEIDEQRYIEMEMGDYEEEYAGEEHQEHQIVVEEEEEVVQTEYRNVERIINVDSDIIRTEDIEVEVGNEVVVSSENNADSMLEVKRSQRATIVDERVVLETSNNEIVIVDGEGDEEMEHHHHLSHEEVEQPGTSTLVEHERYMDANKANQMGNLMEEIAAFKHTILKRADQLSSGNLNSLLIRFQSLHRSVTKKDSATSETLTVFPNRSKYLYRPGKGLEKSEQEYMAARSGDVTLQPIEDEISDDEDILTGSAEAFRYNSTIWS
uniref:C2H2-type domain-containing protein n=1 Tax=Caenorhabditis japonica TaxID=281687 RepID=A0A8R1DNY3_CAEJA